MDIQTFIQLLLTTSLIAGAIFGVFYWIRQRHDFNRSLNFTFLQVSIPKKDSKDDMERDRDQISEVRKVLAIGDHFYSAVNGIYTSDMRALWQKQDFISLEYIATEGQIKFYVGCPRDIKELVEKQITAFYPEAIVEETLAPKMFEDKTYQATLYLKLVKNAIFPIRNYTKFESSDPMNSILNTLSQASNEEGDSAGVQIMIRPAKNNWQQKARKKAKELSSGKKAIAWWNPLAVLGNLFQMMVQGASENPTNNEGAETNESQELTKAMEEKAEKVGFHTIIRCVASSPNQRTAEINLTNIYSAFSQYSGPTINGFIRQKYHNRRRLVKLFIWRAFRRTWWFQPKMILSSEEVNSLFHFPHVKYNNLPSIKWQNYKVVQAPNNIPKPSEGILLGHNQYRGKATPIHMKREDRFRHFYVIGQTGTGKSSIFQVMIRQDMEQGDGLCVVDPHGSLIEDLLPFVPKERIDDVVIFDPADLERPMGLNILEGETEEEKDMIALDAMNIMIKMFDEEVFGPRIQDYFRNGVLTLMADPNGGSLIEVVRLFTDDAFQRSKVKHVTNPVVKNFWTNQMAKTGAREKQEMIPYFASKFGAFVTNGMMRNIIGQTKSSFDFPTVMDEGKILFMNLSKGATGDINSKLLGMIIVSKIQMAALRRQKQSKEERKDFFLYIDEFQNYVTDSIESILSEARKYRLGLNVAHQYMSQIDTSNQKKGVNLKDAILGNVGTMMCYKIGAQDAEVMGKEFAPAFTDQDLINIDKYKAVMKLSVDTQPSKPFSITPVNPYLDKGNPELGAALKQISRLTYGRSKKFVEKEIFTRLDV